MLLGCFHFVFTHVYFLLDERVDSYSYYLKSLSKGEVDFNSSFISEFTGLIARDYFELTYYTTCLIFSWFGFIGFVILLRLISKYLDGSNYRYKSLVVLFLCLPSMHFWSSTLSKESLIMSLVLVSLFSVFKLKTRWPLFLVSIGIIALMRPHVSVILLLSLVLAYVLTSKIKTVNKSIILVVGYVAFYFIVDWIMILFNRPGLSYTSFNAMTREWEQSVRFAPINDTNIVLEGKSYIYKVLSFTFRPLFQFSSLKLSVASLENLLLLLASLSLIRISFLKWVTKWRIEVLYSILAVIGWFGFMSLVSSNYGYAMRQKSTLLPLFIFVILSFWASLMSNQMNDKVS